MRICNCGSGEYSWLLSDARGIPVANVCTECEAETKARYRPEIFTNGCYETDEPIEPEPEIGIPGCLDAGWDSAW